MCSNKNILQMSITKEQLNYTVLHLIIEFFNDKCSCAESLEKRGDTCGNDMNTLHAKSMSLQHSDCLSFAWITKCTKCQILTIYSFLFPTNVHIDYNEELHSLYRSPNIVRVIKSRRLRCASHVARNEEDRSAFRILTGKPTGKRHFKRPKDRLEDNIRIDQ